MPILSDWKRKAEEIERQVYTLYLAYRDPRVPWYARALAALVVAYALSPIDLIPDFIPVLGYLDDLVLIPLGAILAIRLIPPSVFAECQELAQRRSAEQRQGSRLGALIVVALWLILAAIAALALSRCSRS